MSSSMQEMKQAHISDNHYLAVRREFVLKVDGNRPILYSLDYINTQIYFLTPLEGIALSLLDGNRPFSEIKRIFSAFFPQEDTVSLTSILLEVDQRVRHSPSQTGIGEDGLIEFSDMPLKEAQAFDSREFVINRADYMTRSNDVKTSMRLDTPINIYTVFTYRCFTDCIYCYADRKKVSEMPLTRWREIIQEMAELGIMMSSPDNGDVFARKDGIDFFECLLEHNMHFLLTTKAYVSREYVKRLVDAGFTRKVRGVIQRQVQLSFDAAEEEVAKRILNIPRPMIEKKLETLENFLAFGIMPKVKAVITGLNYDQPEHIVKLFYPRGARVFHFVRYHRSFHKHTDELFVDSKCIPELRRQFDEIRDKYPDIDLVENLTQESDISGELTPERIRSIWDNRLGCGGGWYSLGIAADGMAFLCEQMKMDEPFYVGDARSQSIREIWQSQRLLNFIYPEREKFEGTVCSSCGEFEECMWTKGRCYRDAYFSYGSIYEPPPLCPNNSRPGIRLS